MLVTVIRQSCKIRWRIDSLYVGAADFAGFDITAWEEGVEGAAAEIWGDYTLRVVPVDRHGNPQ